MAATTTHKDLAKHFRNRLRVAGIKAGCRMIEFCGEQVIDIYPRGGADVRFTEDEQRIIRTIADVNHLTGPMGSPIDIERMTDDHGARFYLGYA